MTGQVKTRLGTARAAMFTAAFNKGFREARKGLPMDYEAFSGDGETNDRWQYERGRMLAFIYAGQIKHGRRVSRYAIDVMKDAIRARAII